MDKAEALSKIRQYVQEVDRLRQLPRKNQEYQLWKDKVKDILEAGFGRASGEYERFARAVRSVRIQDSEEGFQQEYQEWLTAYETALESILLKYQELGLPPAVERPLDKKAPQP